MSSVSRLIFSCLAIPLLASSASADVLAVFVDGSDGRPTMPAAVTHSNLTASEVTNTAFSAGPVRNSWGADLGSFWITSGHNGTNLIDPGEDATNAEVEEAKGYSWTLTANPGERISLSSVSLEFGITGQANSPVANWGYRVFVKIDGGDFVSIGGNEVSVPLEGGTFVQQDDGVYPVAGSSSIGGSVTLKLVDWGKLAANEQQYGSSANTFRNITINGTAGQSGPVLNQIEVVQTSYDLENQLFVVSYSSGYANGVDVYFSDDLKNWTFDGNEEESGVGLSISRVSENPERYFALVPPGQAFPNL